MPELLQVVCAMQDNVFVRVVASVMYQVLFLPIDMVCAVMITAAVS